MSKSEGLACGPRVLIHLSSKPQGETLHIPSDQRPLSEDSLGWERGRKTRALTGKLENLGLRSPPNRFYIFFSVCHHVPENYCQENEPLAAVRPLPTGGDPGARWMLGHSRGCCRLVSAQRPACLAFLTLHTGAKLCLRPHQAWCGAKGSQDPTASSAVSLPCPIVAKQGIFRRLATAGARGPCPYL